MYKLLLAASLFAIKDNKNMFSVRGRANYEISSPGWFHVFIKGFVYCCDNKEGMFLVALERSVITW